MYGVEDTYHNRRFNGKGVPYLNRKLRRKKKRSARNDDNGYAAAYYNKYRKEEITIRIFLQNGFFIVVRSAKKVFDFLQKILNLIDAFINKLKKYV